jgi:hypothetical protein
MLGKGTRNAWLPDGLKPMSGGSQNPFGGTSLSLSSTFIIHNLASPSVSPSTSQFPGNAGSSVEGKRSVGGRTAEAS